MSYTKTFSDTTQWPCDRFKNGAFRSFSEERTVLGSRSGEKVIDYKSKIKAGLNASSPFVSERLKYSGVTPGSATLSATRSDNPGAGTQTQSFVGFCSIPPDTVAHLSPLYGSAEAIALTKHYRKVRDTQQHWAGASSLAEFGDVLRQFGKPLDAIVDLTNRRLNRLQLEARGLRGSTVFRKVKFAEIVASSYLEYAFGLAPLISDAKKAAEAYARFNVESELTPRTRIISRGVLERASSTTQNVTAADTWLSGVMTQKVVTENRCQYVSGLTAGLNAPFGTNERLIQLLGFSPKDWIPAAWEVVPWSWLLDYFLNVGDILQAGATSTASVAWTCKTVSQQSTLSRNVALDQSLTKLNADYWDAVQASGTLGAYSLIRSTVDRQPIDQLGVPPLSVSLPDGWGQYANMVAVLIAKKPKSSALWLY